MCRVGWRAGSGLPGHVCVKRCIFQTVLRVRETVGWLKASPPQLLSSVSAVRSSRGTSSQLVLSQSGSEPRTSPPPTLPVSQVTGDSWIFILNVCTTMREKKRALNDVDQPVNTLFKLSHTLPQTGPALTEGVAPCSRLAASAAKTPAHLSLAVCERTGVDWLRLVFHSLKSLTPPSHPPSLVFFRQLSSLLSLLPDMHIFPALTLLRTCLFHSSKSRREGWRVERGRRGARRGQEKASRL